MKDRIAFLAAGVRDPRHVGAVWPSSRALARAMSAPLRHHSAPVRVLEIGAGTGVVTHEILRHLGPDDTLWVYERDRRLGQILRRRLAESAPGGAAIRVFDAAIETIDRGERFDFLLSGLPFNNFPADRVQELLDLLAALRAPGGTLTYFEYVGLRGLRRLAPPAVRRRAAALDRVFDTFLEAQRTERRLVLRNLPPAWVRHLRAAGENGDGGSRPD